MGVSDTIGERDDERLAAGIRTSLALQAEQNTSDKHTSLSKLKKEGGAVAAVLH